MTTAPVRRLLAVDGIDGCGKSVFARRLAAAAAAGAGIEPVMLAVDDFRRPVDWQGAGGREGDLYYDNYYDLPLLDRCLAAFLQGLPSVSVPVFDSTSEQLAGDRIIAFGGATLAIVEGVFALRVPAVATAAPLIYLRTSFPEAHRRIVARDTARGRALPDVVHRIETRYFPCQHRYLRDFDPIGRADIVIDNEQPDTPRIDRFVADRFDAQTIAILQSVLGTLPPRSPSSSVRAVP